MFIVRIRSSIRPPLGGPCLFICHGDAQEMAQFPSNMALLWRAGPFRHACYKHDPPLEGRNGMARL